MITKFSKFRRSGALLSLLGALLLIVGIANGWILTHTHSAEGITEYTDDFNPTSITNKHYVGYQASSNGGGVSQIKLSGNVVVECSSSSGGAACNSGYLTTTATHQFYSMAHIFTGGTQAKANAWYGTTAPSYCPNGNGD